MSFSSALSEGEPRTPRFWNEPRRGVNLENRFVQNNGANHTDGLITGDDDRTDKLNNFIKLALVLLRGHTACSTK